MIIFHSTPTPHFKGNSLQLVSPKTFLFAVIRNEAGKAELSLSIISPSGVSVPFDSKATPRGEHVTYCPQEAGPHQIYITYGGLEVPGKNRKIH